MRTQLARFYNKRMVFIATVSRLGKKTNYKGFDEPTILLLDVKDENGNILTDHVWFTYRKRFKDAHLHENDVISFEGRVGMYEKGYRDDDEFNPKRVDYKINNPTKITLLERTSEVKLCEEPPKIPELEELGYICPKCGERSGGLFSGICFNCWRDENKKEPKYVTLFSFVE